VHALVAHHLGDDDQLDYVLVGIKTKPDTLAPDFFRSEDLDMRSLSKSSTWTGPLTAAHPPEGMAIYQLPTGTYETSHMVDRLGGAGFAHADDASRASAVAMSVTRTFTHPPRTAARMA
jgi:hypothetical protein